MARLNKARLRRSYYKTEASILGVGGSRLPDFGQGLHRDRKILLYLIMYRKYVRKWWLLKINRNNFCPEVHVGLSVNGQLLPGKSKLFVKLPEKKSKFVENLPGKIETFLTRIHDPQISNQIDAKCLIMVCSISMNEESPRVRADRLRTLDLDTLWTTCMAQI